MSVLFRNILKLFFSQ